MPAPRELLANPSRFGHRALPAADWQVEDVDVEVLRRAVFQHCIAVGSRDYFGGVDGGLWTWSTTDGTFYNRWSRVQLGRVWLAKGEVEAFLIRAVAQNRAALDAFPSWRWIGETIAAVEARRTSEG